MRRVVSVTVQHFPLAQAFRIARGAKTEAVVVVCEITEGTARGRGECVPYPRYGESVESVVSAIEAVIPALAEGLGRDALQARMPAGAARNAVDCALWDLDAKRSGTRVAARLGVEAPRAIETAYTLSLDEPDAMHRAAQAASHRTLLKVKLGGPNGDPDRIRAVRAGAPRARLILDANEGWSEDTIRDNMLAAAAAGAAMVEQPLPAGRDEILARMPRPVPVCADESLHDRTGLASLLGRYDFVNVKLDKTGGLTEAQALVGEARRLGFGVMVGCMVGSSLAMAPAVLLAQGAEIVDLDGPLLMKADREGGLAYEGSTVSPPEASLWG
jgi:L-Ala-D/L-Glu epimerase